MNNKQISVFERSGLASFTDLESKECKASFAILEKIQKDFLSEQSNFRSPNYKWPLDSLHNFSRVWEYPYVFYHLSKYYEELGIERPVVADIGSGVTFFPFSIASLGYHVICCDIDQVCERDLALARKFVLHAPGDLSFRLINNNSKLPFNDSECDAIYCISVLEHIPDFENTILEMSRILKTNGMCIITCDINLKKNDYKRQLNQTEYEKLMLTIGNNFELLWAEKTVHPQNMLTTKKSPYPLKISTQNFLLNVLKQKIVKPLFGRRPGSSSTPDVAVLGLALKKKVV